MHILYAYSLCILSGAPSQLAFWRVLPGMILAISCLMLVQDTFTGNLLEAEENNFLSKNVLTQLLTPPTIQTSQIYPFLFMLSFGSLPAQPSQRRALSESFSFYNESYCQ